MKSVAIIGAGITGLTAAFYLKRAGVPVTVYEASGRVGGVIQSVRRDGFLAELGPNTILETSPKIGQLVRDAGLQARRLDPDPGAEARYVVRYKRPVEMPGSPLGFFTTELFSWRAKLAVLREPFVKPRRDGVEESIAQFVVRRFNQEFLDHAIDALVAGIYAGDPHRLSVTHAFPKLKALEDNYGSMIRGQIFGARERKKRGEVAKDRAAKFSFDEGLQVLPQGLAAHLGGALKVNTAVTRLTQAADGWMLGLRGPDGETQATHCGVIFACTAPALAKLTVELLPTQAARSTTTAPATRCHPERSEAQRNEVEGSHESSQSENRESDIDREVPPLRCAPVGMTRIDDGERNLIDFSAFSEIRHPPVASVVLGFRREDVAHSCMGFGALIPKVEGFKILGTIFSSALFPDRAPAGHVTLSSYVGGERYPELASLSEDELCDLTCEDLRVLLGVRGKPVFRNVAYYPKAIPQYNVGYGRFKDLMTRIEEKAPGLFFAGHYRDGISLGDSIVSGCNIAGRVEKSAAAAQAQST